jgi:hypothetical protein
LPDTVAITAFASAGVALTVGLASPLLSNRMADRRLSKQLAHERWMKSREERVQLLDSVAQALTSTQRATDEVVALWEDGVAWDDDRRIAATATRWDRLEDLRHARARLALRYPREAKIFERFDAAQQAQNVYRGLLKRYERGDAFSNVSSIRGRQCSPGEHGWRKPDAFSTPTSVDPADG